MPGIEVSCPICQLVFVTDRAYAGHLADAHGLLDDEGTTTTVADAAAAAPNDAAVQAAAAASLVQDDEPVAIDPSRIYDPDAHNPYRPAVAALLIIALLLGGGFTAFRSLSGGDGDAVAAERPNAELTLFAGVDDSKGDGPTTTSPPPSSDTTAPPEVPTTTVPVTTVPPAPVTTRPPPAPAPAPAPTPAPPPPPPAPAFVAPTVVGLRLDICPSNRGSGGIWRFSYVLSGGSSWTASPTATLISGRYYETRDTRYRDISVTSVVVVNALNGASVAIDVPDLTEANCP